MKNVNLRLDESDLQETIGSVTRVGSSRATTDITRVAEYSNKLATIAHITRATAPLYLQDFSIAYDITNTLLYEASSKDAMASNELEMAESIAFFEGATEYLERMKVKESAEARKKYVPLDPGVQAAANKKAQTSAMVTLLRNKLQSFARGIECVKKIAYSDGYTSQDEGF